MIRKMDLLDLPAICEIESEVHAYPWTKGMFADCFNNVDYAGFVVEDNRLLSKPASVREIGGDSERRTGVYTGVHEDSSTESTNKFSTEVGFGKKSNDENNHEVCAYVITQSILDECHILTIGVKETRQKQGLARQLLLFLIEQQRKIFNRILLEVAESNSAAIHLYKKLGFQQIGLRKNYYQSTNGCSDNALIFEKLLNP